MADTKLSVLPQESVPALTDQVYLIDGTPTSYRQTLDRLLGFCLVGQFPYRLTTESGVTVSTSTRASQSKLYLTPILPPFGPAGCMTLYDGTRDRLFSCPEIGIDISAYTSPRHYDFFTFSTTAAPSSTNTSTDVITFGSAQGWVTGAVVTVDSSGGGLLFGTTYYWGAASSTTGSFYTTLANAFAGTSKVDLTATITANVTGISLEPSAAWTNDTTQADAIAQQGYVDVKSADHTRRWVGTVHLLSGGVTEDSVLRRLVWSRYNRVPRPVRVIDPASSWQYQLSTVRQADANPANRVEMMRGLNVDVVELRVIAGIFAGNDGSFQYPTVGVGIDTTTSYESTCIVTPGYYTSASDATPIVTCQYADYVPAGYHVANWNETGGTGTSSFFGTQGGIKSGMIGAVYA